MKDALTKLIVVNISQWICLSNYHIVHLRLIQCCRSVGSQWNQKKEGSPTASQAWPHCADGRSSFPAPSVPVEAEKGASQGWLKKPSTKWHELKFASERIKMGAKGVPGSVTGSANQSSGLSPVSTALSGIVTVSAQGSVRAQRHLGPAHCWHLARAG